MGNAKWVLMKNNWKSVIIILGILTISSAVIADSYIQLDDGFVFEGYQILDENNEELVEYDTNEQHFEYYADLNMRDNHEITGFFEDPCESDKFIADVNESGGFLCISASAEVDSDFVSKDGDKLNGSLDVDGYELQNLDSLTSEGEEVTLDGGLEITGSLNTDTVDMDTSSNEMCIGDQCN